MRLCSGPNRFQTAVLDLAVYEVFPMYPQGPRHALLPSPQRVSSMQERKPFSDLNSDFERHPRIAVGRNPINRDLTSPDSVDFCQSTQIFIRVLQGCMIITKEGLF